jgi:cyclase
MLTTRVIPCLLLRNQGLVKTVKFRDPKYVGDPINAVRIFNEKEVDELVFLDITASSEKKRPNFEKIEEIAGECFMPLAYGGGINSLDDIKTIFSLGVEKVIINSYAMEQPEIIRKAAELYGSQSIVISIDVKMNVFGSYEVVTHSATRKTGRDPVQVAKEMTAFGAGEIFLNSVDRDGTLQGFDIKLIKSVTSRVDIPVIACGGAWTIEHLEEAVKLGGASAVAAGSMFVFQGKHRAVLITYPHYNDLKRIFKKE